MFRLELDVNLCFCATDVRVRAQDWSNSDDRTPFCPPLGRRSANRAFESPTRRVPVPNCELEIAGDRWAGRFQQALRRPALSNVFFERMGAEKGTGTAGKRHKTVLPLQNAVRCFTAADSSPPCTKVGSNQGWLRGTFRTRPHRGSTVWPACSTTATPGVWLRC